MKISCTPISYARSFREGKFTQNDYFAALAEAGAEGSDLMEPAAYPWFWRDFDAERKTVCKRLREHGLALSGYAAGNNFAQPDPAEFARQVEGVKKAIRETAEFEAPCLRIFGGYHEACGGAPGVRNAGGLEQVARGIEAVLPEAERCGVVLALENHGRLPGLSLEVAALCRRFDSPHLRVLFDCANFLANNMDETEDPLAAYRHLKEKVVHCHVKSWRAAPPESDRRVVAAVAGEGSIVPLRQFFYALQESGYQGFCSLEYEAGAVVPEAEGVPRSLANLREMKLAAENWPIN